MWELGFRRSWITDFRHCLIHQKLHVVWNCIRLHSDSAIMSSSWFDFFVNEGEDSGDDAKEKWNVEWDDDSGNVAECQTKKKTSKTSQEPQDDDSVLAIPPLVTEDWVSLKWFWLQQLKLDNNKQLLKEIAWIVPTMDAKRFFEWDVSASKTSTATKTVKDFVEWYIENEYGMSSEAAFLEEVATEWKEWVEKN